MIFSRTSQQQSLYTETLKDKFTFSPLQKFQKYGRWPYKLVLAVLLVILTSLQAVYISNKFQYNNAALIYTWGNEDPQVDTAQLMTIQEFQESLRRTIQNLKDLNDLMVMEIDMSYCQYQLKVNYEIPYFPYDHPEFSYSYDIDIQKPLTSPFDIENTESIKLFWTLTHSVAFHITQIHVLDQRNTVCWDITITYTFQDSGYIVAKLQSIGGICTKQHNSQTQQLQNDDVSYQSIGWSHAMLQITILILAAVDFALNVKYIFEVIQMYTRNIYLQTRIRKLTIPEYKIKKDTNLTTLKIILMQQKPWDQLQFQEKMLFFDLFLPLRLLGNVLQIMASAIILAEGFTRVDTLADYDEILVGFGCFFAWFSIAKYMEYVESLHLIVNILEASIIPLCLAIISFLPVFFAYTIFGLCVFGDSSRFNSVHNAMVSLIALVYQDSVCDVIIKISMNQNLKLAFFYISSYVILFILAVNNIMVALIREQQDQRRDLIDIEKALMEGMDIQPILQQKQGQDFEDSIARPMMTQSILTNQAPVPEKDDSLQYKPEMSASTIRNSEVKQQQRHISIRSITRLAVLLNRKKQKGAVNQKMIESNWQKLASEEIKKNLLLTQMTQIVNEIKGLMKQIEQEFWADLSIFVLDSVEKNEVIHLYCSQLISLNFKLRELYNKSKDIEKGLLQRKTVQIKETQNRIIKKEKEK